MSSLFEIPSQPSRTLLRDPSASSQPMPDPSSTTARSGQRLPGLRRALRVLVIIAVLAGLVAAFLIQRRAMGLPRVRVVPVLRGHVAQSIPAVSAGRVTPASELTVRSEAAARIAKVLVQPGDRVAAGDALFVLEADEWQRAVRAAEAGFQMAQAGAAEAALRVQVARRAQQRASELVASGSLPRVEEENKGYEAQVLAQAEAAARARVAGQRAELEGAERERQHGIVKAPISGLVTAILVVTGESVAPATPLVSLADVSTLHIAAQVDESDASRIELAMPVELRFDGDDGPPLRSVITRLDPRVSDTPQGSRVLGFDVSLPETRKWRLGVSAEVDIITEERAAALLVPVSALVGNGKERQVFVFSADHALPRRVEPGLADFANVEIVHGLGVGESVVENPGPSELSGPSEVRLEIAGPER
jgi:HlyD family secretion protein